MLAACECSGLVRDEFAARGWEAWSCDVQPSEREGNHIQGDVRAHLEGWDLIVGFPPCTHLAVSGARWFAGKREAQDEALAFFAELMWAPARYVVLENPVSVAATRIRAPSQVIQPWMFGHREVKTTCLWLFGGVPLLRATDNVGPPPVDRVARRTWERVHRMGPGPQRARERSRTYAGVARAMAEQWSGLGVRG